MNREREEPQCVDRAAKRRNPMSIERRAFIRGAAALGAAGVMMLGPAAWAARALSGDSSR